MLSVDKLRSAKSATKKAFPSLQQTMRKYVSTYDEHKANGGDNHTLQIHDKSIRNASDDLQQAVAHYHVIQELLSAKKGRTELRSKRM